MHRCYATSQHEVEESVATVIVVAGSVIVHAGLTGTTLKHWRVAVVVVVALGQSSQDRPNAFSGTRQPAEHFYSLYLADQLGTE